MCFRLIVLFSIFLFGVGGALATDISLKDKLWKRIEQCHSHFEVGPGSDWGDEYAAQELFNRVDDAVNGYLHIDGSYPTCGCACESTVAAYKDVAGQYTFLQRDYFTCEYDFKVSSNRELTDVLPEGFGLESFFKLPVTTSLVNSAFYLDVKLPRIGSDTKVTLRRLPFGLPFSAEAEVLTSFHQEMYDSDISVIRDLLSQGLDASLMTKLSNGDIHQLKEIEVTFLKQKLGQNDSRYATVAELSMGVQRLLEIHRLYSLQDYESVVLGWDRKKARFYVKSYVPFEEKLDFKEFVLNSWFWGGMC